MEAQLQDKSPTFQSFTDHCPLFLSPLQSINSEVSAGAQPLILSVQLKLTTLFLWNTPQVHSEESFPHPTPHPGPCFRALLSSYLL
jgi:hypothetical protein